MLLLQSVSSMAATNENGEFELHGCASDPNVLGIFKNNPDPYILIRHACSGHVEDTILETSRTFTPDTYDAGFIDLEEGVYTQDPDLVQDVIDDYNK
jgi:hypothetical protein